MRDSDAPLAARACTSSARHAASSATGTAAPPTRTCPTCPAPSRLLPLACCQNIGSVLTK